MSTPEDFEARLAARLERAGEPVTGSGVTREGVAARHRERARARRLRQGAGTAMAAALLVVLGVAVALGAGDGGGTQIAAEGPSGTGDAPSTAGPSTTTCFPELGVSTTAGPSVLVPSEDAGEATTTSVTPAPASANTRPEGADTIPGGGPRSTTVPTGESTSTSWLSTTPDEGPLPSIESSVPAEDEDPLAEDPCAQLGTPSTPPPPPAPEDPWVGSESTSVPETTLPPESTVTDPPATTAPVWPAVVVLHHGGTSWAVYLAVGPREEGLAAPALRRARDEAAAVGYQPTGTDLACDRGAIEALSLDPAASHVGWALYFAVESDAELFVEQFEPDVAGLADVTNFCLDD